MKFFFMLEKFLVRHFGYSLVSRRMARETGMAPVSTFLLTTTGRKSGRRIDTPIFYYRDGENFFVIASKGGAPQHPIWFLNLQTKPEAVVRVKGRDIPVRARIATGEERDRLWKIAAALYPPYDDYRAKAAPREIPVVVLEKRA